MNDDQNNKDDKEKSSKSRLSFLRNIGSRISIMKSSTIADELSENIQNDQDDKNNSQSVLSIIKDESVKKNTSSELELEESSNFSASKNDDDISHDIVSTLTLKNTPSTAPTAFVSGNNDNTIQKKLKGIDEKMGDVDKDIAMDMRDIDLNEEAKKEEHMERFQQQQQILQQGGFGFAQIVHPIEKEGDGGKRKSTKVKPSALSSEAISKSKGNLADMSISLLNKTTLAPGQHAGEEEKKSDVIEQSSECPCPCSCRLL